VTDFFNTHGILRESSFRQGACDYRSPKTVLPKRGKNLKVTGLEIENDPSLILEIALTALVVVQVEVSPQIVYVRRSECNRA
jgi:hypothetical protein